MVETAPLAEIRRRIDQAAVGAGRDPSSVRLVAISKTFEADAVQPLIDAGQRDFGENRVQEAQHKWPALIAAKAGMTLHLVGPLQSNKAADAVALFDVIHSVDRDKIAAAIALAANKQGRNPELFVQVNTGAEPQKAGVSPTDTADFVARCRTAHGLLIAGLTAIPPSDQAPGPHFALLAKIAQEAGVSRLSMGMSQDFETAIAFGATDVRIGRALFGTRPTSI